MQDSNGQLTDTISNVLLSKYPTTLIDLATGEVRHTSLHKHHVRRHEALRQQLDMLWKGKKDEQAFAPR